MKEYKPFSYGSTFCFIDRTTTYKDSHRVSKGTDVPEFNGLRCTGWGTCRLPHQASLSNRTHLSSTVVMYLRTSLSLLREQPKYFAHLKGSFLPLRMRHGRALPLFTVYYAQHRIHRQNPVHLQDIVDFEALPALVDLP